jgi:hypothetical protein
MAKNGHTDRVTTSDQRLMRMLFFSEIERHRHAVQGSADGAGRHGEQVHERDEGDEVFVLLSLHFGLKVF